MNLKPYKPVVYEPHTVKYPFLERNGYVIFVVVLLVVLIAAYHFVG